MVELFSVDVWLITMSTSPSARAEEALPATSTSSELQAQLTGERRRHINVDARIAGTRRRRDKRRATIGVDAHAQRAILPNGGGN